MGINFDALPNSKPNAIPEKGSYFACIEKAEMKQPKDAAKPPYLNLTLALKTGDGKSCGKLFDMLSESDHEVVRYKLKRFIEALQIPITGNFELKDLCKIVVGKSLIVDVTKDEKDGQPARAVVDVFTNEVYYPMSDASVIFGHEVSEDDAPFTFDAEDALDAAVTSDTEEEY